MVVTPFYLYRKEDVSGTSGTGIVAHGIRWGDGQCTLWWPNFGSIGHYKNLDDLIAIHGHGGRTNVTLLEDVTP